MPGLGLGIHVFRCISGTNRNNPGHITGGRGTHSPLLDPAQGSGRLTEALFFWSAAMSHQAKLILAAVALAFVLLVILRLRGAI